jgi:hypothetical protein
MSASSMITNGSCLVGWLGWVVLVLCLCFVGLCICWFGWLFYFYVFVLFGCVFVGMVF